MAHRAKALVPNNREERKPSRVRLRRDNHYAQVSLLRPLVRRCRHAQEIAAQCPEQLREVNQDKADRDLVSRCGHRVRVAGKPAIVRILHVLADQVAPVVREELLGKGPVRYQWVRGLVRAHRDVPRCCRHFQRKCLRRRSLENRCIPVSRPNGNARPQINEKLKASASSIRPGNVRVQVGAAWLFP